MSATIWIDVEVKCSHCRWMQPIRFVYGEKSKREILKYAWSLGLEHAWDNRGHVVETFVDGHLRATQQVAEMSPWKDHNAVVIEEGVE